MFYLSVDEIHLDNFKVTTETRYPTVTLILGTTVLYNDTPSHYALSFCEVSSDSLQ